MYVCICLLEQEGVLMMRRTCEIDLVDIHFGVFLCRRFLVDGLIPFRSFPTLSSSSLFNCVVHSSPVVALVFLLPARSDIIRHSQWEYSERRRRKGNDDQHHKAQERERENEWNRERKTDMQGKEKKYCRWIFSLQEREQEIGSLSLFSLSPYTRWSGAV